MGGLPLGLLDEGLLKSPFNEPSNPLDERPDLRFGEVGRELVRPGGLPRLVEPRLYVASRLVLVNLRGLLFPLGLRDRILAGSLISGIIAQRVITQPPRG